MKNYAIELISNMKSTEGREYMFKLITYSLAPVLLGEKCASLIRLSNKNKNMYEMWKIHKREYLNMLPLDCYELGDVNRSVALLFYNKAQLRTITESKVCCDFLKEYGYLTLPDLEACFEVLKARFLKGCPHEIGLLLGIPLEDVKAFINNEGENYLYCGYWKVYHNLHSALNTFYLYEEASEEIARRLVTEKNTIKVLENLSRTSLID